MMSHRTRCLMPLIVSVSLLFVALVLPAALASAQEATASAPAAAPVVSQPITATATITATRTPAPTPTATPTFTALQAKLVLVQTYLKGGDFAQAADLFAAIAAEDRGNAEALKGLEAALQGRAAAKATAAAPAVTPTVAATPAARATLGDALAAKWRDLGSSVLIGLLLVVLAYLLAQAIRWLLFWMRELWLLRILPLLRRPAVPPGFLIGEFADATGLPNFQGIRLAVQTLTEKLVAWNQLVQAKEVPVEMAPVVDLGGMGWVKVLWNWILPPPRGYKVTGVLLGDQPGDYKLTLQRVALASNRVDASQTFTSTKPTPESAFVQMAAEAAKWLLNPRDMEAGAAAARGLRAARSVGAPLPMTASEVFDQALDLLLPVRQQVSQGAIDFADARRRLQEAQGLLSNLPDSSELRRELEGVIADLRRAVPAV